MKALVVDDQANVRLLLSHILRTRNGCTVSVAANGREALALLVRESFDIVVLDLLMPVLDGVETLTVIRRTPALSQTPVIVLSAVRDERKVRQLLRLGIAAYLTKPLRPLDVAERIQQILDRLGDAPAVADDGPAERALAARADLRPQMIAATEQLFGLMLGIEVGAAGTREPLTSGDDVASAVLRLEREAVDLEFAITAPRAMSERMTAQYLQAGDVVTDADVSATLREFATIIGGRLQTALRQRGDVVSLGEPTVSRLGAEACERAGGIRVTYTSSAHDLRFMTTLRAVPGARLARTVQDADRRIEDPAHVHAATPATAG